MCRVIYLVSVHHYDSPAQSRAQDSYHEAEAIVCWFHRAEAMGSLPGHPLTCGVLGHNHLPSLSVSPMVGATSSGALAFALRLMS